MNIDSIQNGIVIDHITAGKGMIIYDRLGLNALPCQVALITNASSKRMGKKDILKVDMTYEPDYDVLAYIDPGVTVSIIRDGHLAEKKTFSAPEELRGIVKCQNPRCITTTEQELPQIFRLTDKKKRIYRCIYCEQADKTFS